MTKDAVWSCLRQYGGFQGRTNRAEFWHWVGAVSSSWLVLTALWWVWDVMATLLTQRAELGWTALLADRAITVGIVVGLFTLLPTTAAMSRRLRDTGRTGWTVLAWYALPAGAWGLVGLVAFQALAQGLAGRGPSVAPLFIVLGIASAVTLGVVAWAAVLLSRPGDPFLNQHGKPKGTSYRVLSNSGNG